jgi:hypothetical protein
MASRFGLSFNWNQKGIPADVVERLRGWISQAAALPSDAVIKVNEIVCTDPSCPGTETVLLVMAPGFATKAYKVQADAITVTQAQVAAAVAAASSL